jgi:hypothetical protein
MIKRLKKVFKFMNKSNSSESELFSFSEVAEHVSEIFYLLNFFSQTQLQQWEGVPDKFTPAWVEIGSIQCNTDNSIHFLALILSGRIYLNGFLNIDDSPFCEKMRNLLFYEIGGLLDDWILAICNIDFIFLKRPENEIMDNDRIWLIVSRLCKIALSYEDWNQYEIDELSFDYFVKKYTSPYDPV